MTFLVVGSSAGVEMFSICGAMALASNPDPDQGTF